MAREIPERLFRDDGGAALERAARLEDENKALRAEVERLRAVGHRPSFGERPPHIPAAPARAAAIAFSVGIALVGTTIALFSHHHHHRRSMVIHTVTPRDYVRGPQTRLENTPVEIATDCSPPYRVDPNGRRRWKIDCL